MAISTVRKGRDEVRAGARSDDVVKVRRSTGKRPFEVTSIEASRKQVGSKRYPDAREIFITADADGSNGYRSHVWKQQLQPTGKKVSAKELRELKIERDDFHGDWNYVIKPRADRR
jgi:hypothetical protein